MNNSHSSSSYNPSPQKVVFRGSGTPENYNKLYNDIAASYALALRWKISGNVSFAETAVSILDAWSSTLESINGTSDKYLASGLYGYELANAFELLRDFSEWNKDKQSLTLSLLLRVFYPMNLDFLLHHNNAKVDHYWANWDLCNMNSMLAIGVVTNNQTIFNFAIEYFKKGAGNGMIQRTIWKIYNDGNVSSALGQVQESGRDQGHSMLDVAMLGSFAQMAFNQGYDLFAYLDNLILKGAEYVAKYNLGFDVPYTQYANSDVIQPVISPLSRGDVRPIWELLYNHYAGIKRVAAPWTQLYASKVRAASGGAEGGGGGLSLFS